MTVTRRDFVQAGGLAMAGLALAPGALDAIDAIDAIDGTSAVRTEDALVIANASVFDARTRQHRRGQSVLVRGDRIVAIGPAATFAVPTGARVIDATGKFLIPGLIDAHVHMTAMLQSANLTGEEVLPIYLRHGVTTVRSGADVPERQRELRALSEREPHRNPRIVMASRLLDGDPAYHPSYGQSLTDVAQVRPFVRQMKDAGVETLKLYIGISREVGRRIIEEGHAHGMRVIGHLRRYTPIEAAEDGIDVLEHIMSVADVARLVPDDRFSFEVESAATQRLIDALVGYGTAVDPTFTVVWGTLFFPDDPAVQAHADVVAAPEALQARWREENVTRSVTAAATPMARRQKTFADYQRFVGLLYRAGVPILVGTDAPNMHVAPGVALHHELEFLAASGLTNGEVLAAATLGNARALAADDRVGTIEPGRLADLVLLEGDPLMDIRQTRRIAMVVRSGQVVSA